MSSSSAQRVPSSATCSGSGNPSLDAPQLPSNPVEPDSKWPARKAKPGGASHRRLASFTNWGMLGARNSQSNRERSLTRCDTQRRGGRRVTGNSEFSLRPPRLCVTLIRSASLNNWPAMTLLIAHGNARVSTGALASDGRLRTDHGEPAPSETVRCRRLPKDSLERVRGQSYTLRPT